MSLLIIDNLLLIIKGTAVFNGGFSTFLAFSLVAFSNSYVFLTFFKVKTSFEAKFKTLISVRCSHAWSCSGCFMVCSSYPSSLL